ncbi:glycosyltransferase family protein [Desulfococcaceae bacterium HSG7]|nr:glycosyltransferase family protein [Desulfococcaceae bacterium HSG7]
MNKTNIAMFPYSDISIAFFISPHGFGHASRASAVMDALWRKRPEVHFEIFTQVPLWFFENSLSAPFSYHSCLTDIGMAQKSSLHEDLDKTLELLDRFLPFEPSWVSRLAERINRLKCRLVVSDIAPLGIAVARKADVPSVLVENFTWDWIYRQYEAAKPQFGEFAKYLQDIFTDANHHVQTEPVCRLLKTELHTLPVSRALRSSSAAIRKRFDIDPDRPLVLITMGGIPERNRFIDLLRQQSHITFIIPGGADSLKMNPNVILFPFDADVYHPDLVQACDAVIGKVGYSTLAEVYHAGIPFGYIPRPKFRESKQLSDYIARKMSGMPIAADEFESGHWISYVDDLLALPRISRSSLNGSEQAADYLAGLM